MKTYGTAVLTALQAQHKSIDEIERLIQHRRYKPLLRAVTAKNGLIAFGNKWL